MTITFHLPADQQAQLDQLAAARGLTAEQVVTELVTAGLATHPDPDPSDAFIGSGRSGRTDLARRHREILTEAVPNTTARDA